MIPTTWKSPCSKNDRSDAAMITTAARQGNMDRVSAVMSLAQNCLN
jgi:hypothetical protein